MEHINGKIMKIRFIIYIYVHNKKILIDDDKIFK